MIRSTPWALMLAAARGFGVPPSQFWLLSLVEWRALVAPVRSGALPRADFEALARRFPD